MAATLDMANDTGISSEASTLGTDAPHQIARIDDGKDDLTRSSEPNSNRVAKVEEKSQHNSGPVRSVTGFKLLQWVFAHLSVLLTVLLFAIDGKNVADIQPSIIDTFGEVEKLPWIGVALSLGTVSILPHGKAMGVFNVKWYFLIMVLGFEVGSIICGAALTMDVLIVGPFLQGFFGCGVYAGGLRIVAISTTNRERPLYFSGIITMYGIGSVIGPVIGGAFAENSATWRWAFYLNLVVVGIFTPGFLFCLPSINPMDIPLAQKFFIQDWIGFTAFEAGTACYAMALTFGGIYYPFDSGSEIALWVMTGVLLIAFLLLTIYHPGVAKENRLYPGHFTKNMELNILQFQILVCGGTMLTTIYYTPLIFQFTRGDGALEAGIRLLPLMSMMILFSILKGALMPKLGYYSPWQVTFQISCRP
ncbi:MFS drug efflux transporter [Seiridium cupressi]